MDGAITMQKLAEAEITEALESVPDWGQINDEIQRTFGFEDFNQSIAFVNKVAEAAEASQHHPDILIRYNKVTLTLSTHDAGGITERDFAMAKTVDGFVTPA